MSRYIPLKVPINLREKQRAWGIWDELWKEYCSLPKGGEMELLKFQSEPQAIEWIDYCLAVALGKDFPNFIIWRSFSEGVPHGWYASRRPVPSPEEIDAGVSPNYSAKTAEELRAILSDEHPERVWF